MNYIGKKGYTIYKNQYSDDVIESIKKELMLKPQLPMKQFGNVGNTEFPVYRENTNKLYIPRFYGIDKLGMPDKSELSIGENIDLPFAKDLRPYQENIVNIYMNHVKPGSGGGILEVPCGRGKCLGINTPIIMYDGSIKMVQDIVVGDVLMGDDSTPRNVMSLARGREQMYKIVPDKGEPYVVNESHILSLKHKYTKDIHDICVLDYLQLKYPHHYLGYRVHVVFETPPKKTLGIPIKENMEYEISVVKTHVDDYYGFTIDGNRRFVLGDFTVTHNTVMALKIISNIQKKTLILVHKEFLMNQWIERIKEFTPSAQIGRIQAQICDIENKDIVLGMIQTMYNKEFPQEIYDTFGLTVIDEVHRIGSEEFSKTLLKVVTPYMLGISATVERKDKLTKLLYMFIGPKIYCEQRSNEHEVCVRSICYETRDDEFNTIEYDFRGNVKYSTMISKLCGFGPRSDFIISVIRNTLTENPESQMMILAHNKNLLTYLHDKIEHEKIASVGYYIGGMKQSELEKTESKQIVIATYAMAAEALDIKTLSILLMATPKTDITQSVGRILRMKHDNPLVIDIVDSHECFQNQFNTRKRFYKKSEYVIKQITSKEYMEDPNNFITIYDPKAPVKKTKKGDGCLINISRLKDKDK